MAPLEEFWRSAEFLAVAGASIGFAIWGIRHKYELDTPMDSRGKLIRWSIVLGGWLIASLPFPPSAILGSIRAVAVMLSLALLCWPNLVVHVMRRLGRPVAISEAQNGPA